MEKIIILYSDLEGTILRESDGQYDDIDMFHFLKQISKLQEITGAKVKMHIVSPVSQNQMTEILGKLDKNFISFNRLQKEQIQKIDLIEGAAASAKDEFVDYYQEENFFYNKKCLKKVDPRVISLKKSLNSDDKNPAGFGKYNYVKNWTEMVENRYDIKMMIYCGNGRNDLLAMDYIKEQKGGVIICPKNTRREIKAKTNFVGQKVDIQGVTEGLLNLNMLLEKKLGIYNEKVEDENQHSLE